MFAHQMAYQATLGPSAGHIYAPWRFLQWFSKWSEVPALKPAFGQAVGVGTVVFGVGVLITAAVKLAKSNAGKGNAYLHGSARWADMRS